MSKKRRYYTPKEKVMILKKKSAGKCACIRYRWITVLEGKLFQKNEVFAELMEKYACYIPFCYNI